MRKSDVYKWLIIDKRCNKQWIDDIISSKFKGCWTQPLRVKHSRVTVGRREGV